MAGYIKGIRKKIGHDRLMVVGAGVFVYQNGRVLLQKRRDNGCWSSHGGCVEIGEDVEAAAKRELFEETGLIASNLEFMGISSGEEMLYTYPNGDMVYIVSIEYLCREFIGELLPETDETLELKWFNIDALLREIPLIDRKIFGCFLEYIERNG